MRDILDAITRYADAYALLERLQRESVLLPSRGDQKTGVIAEFYARCYAGHAFAGRPIIFGGTSQHAWDLEIGPDPAYPHAAPLRIQVKSVSAFARYSRLSAVHPGWDELWLLRLDERLWPAGFLRFERADHAGSAQTHRALTMPRRGIGHSGSRILQGGSDELGALLGILHETPPSTATPG